jgi:hypothetical protein
MAMVVVEADTEATGATHNTKGRGGGTRCGRQQPDCVFFMAKNELP